MDSRIHIAACAAFAFGLGTAHAAPKLPRISSIAATLAPDGTYSATITGTHFGAAPSDVPCTSCYPAEMQVVDLNSQPNPQAINVTGWSDTSITITEVAVAAGDAVRVAVYNVAAGNTAAFGGRIGKLKGAPKISSITTSGSGQGLVVTINGSGFGPPPSVVGSNTDSPFLVLTDFNAQAPGTNGFPWNAGFCGANDCDGVTANYTSWSDTQVVINGFGSSYGNTWQVNKLDSFCVGIWPSTSTSNGTTGGTTKCIRLPQ